jgi:hypothetical protein
MRVIPSLISTETDLISNHFVLDDQIGAEAGIDSDALIDNRDRLLADDPESTPRREAAKTQTPGGRGIGTWRQFPNC